MAVSPSSLAERAAPELPGLGTLAGVLELGARRLPATLEPASRLALAVRVEGELPDGSPIDGLTVETDRGPQRLGACRFAAGPEPGAGKLLFREHLYDCRALFQEGRVVDLSAVFENLPAVLAQKDHIRPEFRAHVADLSYDLSVHRRFFDDQDRLLATEPPDAAAAAGEALLATEGRRFLSYLDARVAELRELVRGYSQEDHERHGFYLRRQLWPYLLSSEFLKRSNLKPSGYPGDAEQMLMIYENAFVGSSTFSQLLHKHPLETAAAQAVRARRRFVPRELAAVRARRAGQARGRLQVLSLACGPASELREMVEPPGAAEGLQFLLLDQDPGALELARRTVRGAEAEGRGKVAARFLQDSVRTMIRARDLPARLGESAFVYSMGLFDYLTTPVARAVLARAFELVARGGTLLVGNFHVACPSRVHMDYWGDWPLVYRTEEAFVALSDGLPFASRTLAWDETRCQMFLRLEKRA
jgi:extracellular factor (EF) 3-hydroxypalmitic acid methyl ester biosynthesis protein